MMTSTGGIEQYRPELLGKYELQYELENNRIVYENNESLMYMFSVKRNDVAAHDGMWMVCNVLFKCYHYDLKICTTQLHFLHYQ